jgi:cytochrome c biogenesis protein CcmG/thiol:disulfide interchange protein DsbE
VTGRLGALRRPRSVIVAAALAVAAIIGGLAASEAASGHQGPSPLRIAKPFSLGQLGHPATHLSLSQFAGEPVIVNFFASWCGPCQHETPLLASFYRQHGGKIHIIGVDSNDPTAKALKFLARERVSYPVAADPFPADTAVSYGVLGLPQTFFLNARHKIVRHVVGAVTASELNAWAQQLGQAKG